MNCPVRPIACILCLLLCGSRLHAQTLPVPPPDPQAQAHRDTAKALAAKYDYAGAIQEYQQAYLLDKTAHLEDATLDLNKIGSCYLSISQYPKALNFYQQELALEQQIGDKASEVRTLNNIGLVYDDLSQYAKALDFYQPSLAIERQVGDKAGEATTLSNIGAVYKELSQYAKALDFYQPSLAIERQVGDKASEATTLNNIGAVYDDLSQYAKALDFYQQALPLRRQVGDKAGEAATLSNIGAVYKELSQYAKALDFYQQALPIERQVGDKAGEATTLSNIGGAYDSLSQYAKALDFYQPSLAIERQVGDKASEATTLSNIGAVYKELSQYAKALDFYQQALPIERQVGDKASEATTLNNIGAVYDDLSQYAKALDFYQQALPLRRQVGDKAGEARTLNNIGLVYDDLSQYAKALDFYQQALPLRRQVGDKAGEARTLNNIGLVYDDLSQYAKALDFYQPSLAIERQVGDKAGEATTLSNIGGAYDSLSQYAKALDFYQPSLAIERQVGDKAGEAATLNNIGLVYDDLSQYAKALDFYQQALPLRRQVGDKAGEAATLSNIGLVWKLLRQPGVAVFYGKQAVNVYQSIRANISALDEESRKSYLAANQGTYRILADLLIGQGRLTEAQQVLRLLKEREFYDFLNPDPNAPPPPMDNVVLTKREADWKAAYDKAAKPLTDLGAQEQTLRVKKSRTPAEDAQRIGLQAQIAQATTALSGVQKQIAPAFSGPPTADDRLPQTTGAQDVQRALPSGTVALYTIVAPDKLNLILITASGQKAYASAVTADALYAKVLALRQALTDPSLDPRPLAADLYHLVLEPVQKDLDAAGAEVILFSLDDALRYVPPAALYNPQTKQYVAESYQTELITLAGATPTAPVSAKPSVLGLGVSTSQDGAPALPGVATELAAIVHEPQDTGGLVPGRRLLDGQFTQATLEESLKTAGYPLVHLASHFALHGTQDTSYLLLGDGSHLSVAELAKDPHRFQGVELLTLSACQTAMEVRGSAGREVEGVGALAQTLGAGSVLASLWPVSDAATPSLMTALYGYRQQHPASSLAEALQAAQLSLLHKPIPMTADKAKRGTEAVANRGESAGLPLFVADPGAPYAHPFYWAPFILIGNWK